MSSTKTNVLWTVLHHTGSFTAIIPEGGNQPILPLFSSPKLANEWTMGMGLEQHVLSTRMWPKDLTDILKKARDKGFSAVVLNPPHTHGAGFRSATIEDFLRQAEAKCR